MTGQLEQQEWRVVVCAFMHHDGEIFLARRALSKRIAGGLWHLPGGHVEFGEDPAQALIRELREELAIDVQPGEPCRVFSYLKGTVHTVGIAYMVELQAPRSTLQWASSEFEECQWVGPAHLARYFPVDDHNFTAALAGFERLRRPRASA